MDMSELKIKKNESGNLLKTEMAKEYPSESIRKSLQMPKRVVSSKIFEAKEQFDSESNHDNQGTESLLTTGIGNFNMNLGQT